MKNENIYKAKFLQPNERPKFTKKILLNPTRDQNLQRNVFSIQQGTKIYKEIFFLIQWRTKIYEDFFFNPIRD
jgi:hypothetical protein